MRGVAMVVGVEEEWRLCWEGGGGGGGGGR